MQVAEEIAPHLEAIERELEALRSIAGVRISRAPGRSWSDDPDLAAVRPSDYELAELVAVSHRVAVRVVKDKHGQPRVLTPDAYRQLAHERRALVWVESTRALSEVLPALALALDVVIGAELPAEQRELVTSRLCHALGRG